MNFPPIGRSFEAITSYVKDKSIDDSPLKNASIGNLANAASAVVSGPVLGPILGANEIGKRELEPEERALVKEYFGESIDLDKVTINEASVGAKANGLVNENSRPFVIGNTINYDKPINLDDPIQRSTFLHEMTHVWQFQNTEGAGVQRDGAIFEARDGLIKLDRALPTNFFENEKTGQQYVLETSKLKDPENFQDFNIEQQAEVVRGYDLLMRRRELGEELDSLNKSGNYDAEHKQDLVDGIEAIEDYPLYGQLTRASVTESDLYEFMKEIKNHTPTEDGIAYEANEAFDEILNSPRPGLEIIEGSAEVVAESVESAGENIWNGGKDAINGTRNALDEVAAYPWQRLR